MNQRNSIEQDQNVRPKRLVVTGSGSEIGHSVTLAALADGWLICTIDREPVTVAAEIHAFTCDLSDSAAIEATFAAISNLWGAAPDAIIHCDSAYRGSSAVTESIAEWDSSQDINVRSTFLVAQAGAREILQMRGSSDSSIVLLGSVSANRGEVLEPSVAFATAKGAVESMTFQLSSEWGPFGIRVNTVQVGIVESDIGILGARPGQSRRVAERIPLRRFGTPDEVAEACLFLASPRSSYITGANLPVDGGFLAR